MACLCTNESWSAWSNARPCYATLNLLSTWQLAMDSINQACTSRGVTVGANGPVVGEPAANTPAANPPAANTPTANTPAANTPAGGRQPTPTPTKASTTKASPTPYPAVPSSYKKIAAGSIPTQKVFNTTLPAQFATRTVTVRADLNELCTQSSFTNHNLVLWINLHTSSGAPCGRVADIFNLSTYTSDTGTPYHDTDPSKGVPLSFRIPSSACTNSGKSAAW
ncbi:hypothetical protein HDU86_001355 [Geranomyces michiganensis]|nr:hypothetical protein HDU86_001355 [Geranomyces michiganensis]